MSYIEIGAFDAKAKLSELLRDVERGRRYTICIRGRPVADLIPTGADANGPPHSAIEAMRAIQKISGVSGEQLAGWIAEGRR